MYEVKYDDKKNRMYVRLDGFVKKEEAIAYRLECEREHKKLRPGATFLMDAVKLKTLPQDSMEEIQKVRAHAVDNGMVKGAMVLENNILIMQARRTARKITGFSEEYFTDLEAAKKYLDI